MITEPELEHREPQPYVAIGARVPIPFATRLPPLWKDSRDWLSGQGLAPSGPPFIRYLTTDMSKKLDIEVGWPVAAAVSGEGRIVSGVFPAGLYAVLTYTGTYRGTGLVKATAALLAWADAHHVAWQKTTSDPVECWDARIEYYLSDPDKEPDPKKWQTELAFLTANGRTAPAQP